MAYELDPNEGFATGIRRMAGEQVDGAIALLADAASDPATRVHQTRKHLKKTRALLRLARPALPRSAYRAEDVTYRDAGRLLAPAREDTVAALTARKVEERLAAGTGSAPATRTSAELAAWIAALEARRAATLDAACGPDGPADVARRRLEAARGRIDAWPIASEEIVWARPGVRRVYRRGRKRMRDAAQSPTPGGFHEWRKYVEHLWHHLMVLRPLSPGIIEPLIERVHALSDHLGDANDLADLVRRLEAECELAARPVMREAGTLADNWRTGLWAEALTLGRDIYGPMPDAFVERLAIG